MASGLPFEVEQLGSTALEAPAGWPGTVAVPIISIGVMSMAAAQTWARAVQTLPTQAKPSAQREPRPVVQGMPAATIGRREVASEKDPAEDAPKSRVPSTKTA